METYDTDKSGTLEFVEFLSMVMSPTHFKFRVISCHGRIQIYMRISV